MLDNEVLDVGSNTTTNRNFTIAAWIKVDALDNDYNYIVSKDIGSRTFNFNVTSGGELFLGVFGPGGNNFLTGSTPIPTTGVWVHVTATYELASDDSTRTLNLYVDGVPDGTLSGTGGLLHNTTANIEIGRREESPFRYFNGRIDDVCIWNRTLSVEEVEKVASMDSRQSCARRHKRRDHDDKDRDHDHDKDRDHDHDKDHDHNQNEL